MNVVPLSVTKYLESLRSEGYSYYSLAEILEAYEAVISSMVEGYDDYICEYESDMEIWNILKNVCDLINDTPFAESKVFSDFVERMNKADQLLIDNSIPIKASDGLPWWYYRVLKRGSDTYADDVKLSYGIDIERIE